ncbi:NAD(P)H-dependent oxidoreductase [bacterium]|nr:NAD(P)H-dependent oxidoreductase [bacterium]
MKIAIIYFSLSGRTRKLSYLLKETLEEQEFNVSISSLETKNTGSFVKNCIDAFKQKSVTLESIPDVKETDLIFLGSPVWAFDISPAMRSFIEQLDLSGKQVFLILTYGSGKGKDRAMNNFENLSNKKGAEVLGKRFVKGRKVDEEFPTIQGGIKECLKQFQQTKRRGQ